MTTLSNTPITDTELSDLSRRSLVPPKRYGVSEWAVQKPFLIAEKGALYPGPYSLDRTPYWREPLDAAGDPNVRRINVVAPPQSGKTKFAEIVITWMLSHRPTNCLYIRPAEPDLDEAFRDRFAPIFFRNLPMLVPNNGSWVVLSKNQRIELTNAIVYGAAATVPRTITSRTTPFILYDETDTGGDTGNDLGNTLDLADERQMAGTAALSMTLGVSSPKHDTGSNWIAYDQRSDRRTYHEPCPHCGVYQDLKWENFHTLDDDRDTIAIITDNLARYTCTKCGCEIEPQWQSWMADRGVWVPQCQTVAQPLPIDDENIVNHDSLAILPDGERWDPQLTGDPPRNPHRGYHVWAANTKWEQRSWSHMMARWFEVSKTRDPERLQVFTNSWRALPWKQSIGSASVDVISRRVGTYEPRVVPASAKIILGAIDVQNDCLWYSFRAFGANQESWLIQYGTVEVHNDDYQSALNTLYEMAIYQGWPIKGEDDLMMRAYAMAVDSGYRTDEVYEFARRQSVIAIKGEDIAKYRVKRVQVEGKKRPDPVDLWHLNMRAFKDRLQRYLKQPTDEPGGYHLHSETTQEYINHLSAEELKPRRSNAKIFTWQIKSSGRPNHLLDTEAYTLALTEALEQRREVSLMVMRDDDPPICVFRRGQGRVTPPAATPGKPQEHNEWAGDAARNWNK